MTIEHGLFYVAEAAVYLRYSSGTIYKLIHANTLKAVKRGRCYLVLKKSLDDYIDANLYVKD